MAKSAIVFIERKATALRAVAVLRLHLRTAADAERADLPSHPESADSVCLGRFGREGPEEAHLERRGLELSQRLLGHAWLGYLEVEEETVVEGLLRDGA